MLLLDLCDAFDGARSLFLRLVFAAIIWKQLEVFDDTFYPN